jgi:hypothetical protein
MSVPYSTSVQVSLNSNSNQETTSRKSAVPNNAFARLDFNHQSLEPSGAVRIILVPDKIRVNIRITFFIKKQEPALGRALQVGFEDRCGNDHWGNRKAYRAMPFTRSL